MIPSGDYDEVLSLDSDTGLINPKNVVHLRKQDIYGPKKSVGLVDKTLQAMGFPSLPNEVKQRLTAVAKTAFVSDSWPQGHVMPREIFQGFLNAVRRKPANISEFWDCLCDETHSVISQTN